MSVGSVRISRRELTEIFNYRIKCSSLPMKWYKALVNYIIFFYCWIPIVRVIILAMENQIPVALFPIFSIDIVTAIVLLKAREEMKRFHLSALKYLAVYGCVQVVILLINIFSSEGGIVYGIGESVPYALFLYMNFIYFKKRACLLSDDTNDTSKDTGAKKNSIKSLFLASRNLLLLFLSLAFISTSFIALYYVNENAYYVNENAYYINEISTLTEENRSLKQEVERAEKSAVYYRVQLDYEQAIQRPNGLQQEYYMWHREAEKRAIKAEARAKEIAAWEREQQKKLEESTNYYPDMDVAKMWEERKEQE